MKDFYRITDLSAIFLAWQEQHAKEIDTPMLHIQLWQAQFMLAIAQQLSIVASHLGKIVRKAEEPK